MNFNPITNKFISTHSQCLTAKSPKINGFGEYSNVYWAVHCQLAADNRTSGKLKSIFQFFVSGNGGTPCSIELWSAQLPYFLAKFNIAWDLIDRLEDTIVILDLAAAWFIL